MPKVATTARREQYIFSGFIAIGLRVCQGVDILNLERFEIINSFNLMFAETNANWMLGIRIDIEDGSEEMLENLSLLGACQHHGVAQMGTKKAKRCRV